MRGSVIAKIHKPADLDNQTYDQADYKSTA
jgi:hypothetical protein